jgi:hypothetical protein
MMTTKLRLLQTLTITAVLACGFVAGHAWSKRDYLNAHHAGFVAGQRDTTAYVEDCTIDDAHAGKCSLPCSGEADCVAKNGRGDAY